MNVLLCAFVFFFSTAVSALSLNKMVVFGDSLSDNGNLYEYMNHQLPMSPPYFQGRFTNGSVWVELLLEQYYPKGSSLPLFDYAYGGAGVLEEEDDDDGLFTLRGEMNQYFLAHHDKADERGLYVVWIGSNNYLALPEEKDKAIQEVSQGLLHGLERLADHGAKHILVVNVPDLGRIPAARDFDAVSELTYLAKTHNRILQENVDKLRVQYPDVQWLYFDVNLLMDDMMTHPSQFGFSNINDTCYEALIDKPSKQLVVQMAANITSVHAKNACDGYLFFDPVHPSAHAHWLMAERTKQLLDEMGIVFE